MEKTCKKPAPSESQSPYPYSSPCGQWKECRLRLDYVLLGFWVFSFLRNFTGVCTLRIQLCKFVFVYLITMSSHLLWCSVCVFCIERSILLQTHLIILIILCACSHVRQENIFENIFYITRKYPKNLINV